MKKTQWLALFGLAAVLGALAGKAAAEDKKAQAPTIATDATKAPETVTLDKTGKMAPVNFPHAAHIKKFDCKECHGGDAPLFPQKKQEAGMKMADMYAGKSCGTCHDGKKQVDGKAVFAAKTGCMKCHKKAS